jgi:hypothetical protein
MRRVLLLTIVAVVALAGAAPEPKKSGLKPGNDLPGPFSPYNITGKHVGRFHCLVCQNGQNPVALVFIRGVEVDTATRGLLEQLDQAIKANEKARMGGFAVFIDDQVKDLVAEDDKRDELVKKVEDSSLKLDRLVLALESKENLNKYALDDNAAVTVVLYNRLKVIDTKTFAKGKLDAAGIKALVDEAVEKLTKKPSKPAGESSSLRGALR